MNKLNLSFCCFGGSRKATGRRACCVRTKISHAVLASCCLLPLVAEATDIPDLSGVSIPYPQAPDFDSDDGFKQYGLPAGGWGHVSLTSSTWQNQINSSELSYSLRFTNKTRDDPDEIVMITGTNHIVDAGQRDLRLYQDINAGLSYAIRVGDIVSPNRVIPGDFELRNVGSLQIFAIDNYRLVSVGSQSSLTVNAKNVWLENEAKDNLDTNTALLFVNNNALATFDVEGDFVTRLNIGPNSSLSDSYSLIKASGLNIDAQNIFVLQQFDSEERNTKSIGLYLYGGGQVKAPQMQIFTPRAVFMWMA